MSFKFSNTFLFIIIAIVFGGLSGVLGFIIIGAGNFSIPLLGKINYVNPGVDRNIVIEQPRSVVIEQDVQVKNIENKNLPTIVNIYPVKKSTDLVASAYTASDFSGLGMMLTADGWLISTDATFNNAKVKYSAVGYQNKQYDLSSIISDPATGLAFAKAEGAVNLPVAKIVKSDDLTLGQTVVVVGGRDRILVTSIAKIGYQFATSKELILNSDILSKRIYLSSQLDESYNGASLVNFKGEVIGIVFEGAVIPADYFLATISQILNKQSISRAKLGVDYLDLAQVDGLINWGDRGAYIVNEPLKGSGAFGFVRKGDLIKKVNDFELNAFKGLAEAVNEFKPGDRVDLSLTRNKQDLVISVILK